jgi:hypothetical protein
VPSPDHAASCIAPQARPRRQASCRSAQRSASLSPAAADPAATAPVSTLPVPPLRPHCFVHYDTASPGETALSGFVPLSRAPASLSPRLPTPPQRRRSTPCQLRHPATTPCQLRPRPHRLHRPLMPTSPRCPASRLA